MVNANYASLPPEVRGIIAGYCDGGVTENSTRDEIREAGRTVASLARVDRAIRPKCLAILSLLRYLYQDATRTYMTHKYTAYNTDEPSQLMDALMTGLDVSLAQHTFGYFTDEIHRDIRDMIIHLPDTIHYDGGELRCFPNVSPLFVVCVNPKIPLDIVELLLVKGADVTATIHSSEPILADLCQLRVISPDRLEAIRALLVKHGRG